MAEEDREREGLQEDVFAFLNFLNEIGPDTGFDGTPDDPTFEGALTGFGRLFSMIQTIVDAASFLPETRTAQLVSRGTRLAGPVGGAVGAAPLALEQREDPEAHASFREEVQEVRGRVDERRQRRSQPVQKEEKPAPRGGGGGKVVK